MQSSNYIPGTAGWKLHDDGTLEINPTAVRVGAPDQPKTSNSAIERLATDTIKISDHKVARVNEESAGFEIIN